MEIVDDYTNPENPGAFSSIKTFLKNTNGEYTEYAKNNILPSLDAYSLHKPVRHKFKRIKYMSGGIDDFWQADLIDVKNLYNKRYRQAFNFILVCFQLSLIFTLIPSFVSYLHRCFSFFHFVSRF